jgi:hypothetical protein
MKPLTFFLVAAMFPAFVGAADLSGTWISCDPKAPWHYTVLSVDRDGSTYRWLAEWGSPYAASGSAARRGSALELRGCSSYRGDLRDGCDRDNPPVFLTLEKSDLERYRKVVTQADLRLARWVRATGRGKAWDSLVNSCLKLVEKKQGSPTR